ncbi:LuxR C-terminal-related transcriptional regulator [Kribbella sp. NPDC006257]|uniref:LuxR C-terminal-related transcriptional regulator n=1 Tax=Kribbella sp. NPDC006257 TaxID=3156738 RepID=UPI0033B84907
MASGLDATGSVAECAGGTVVANIGLGQIHPSSELSEHERLFRDLLPEPVADSYFELLGLGQRPVQDAIDDELVTRQLAYLHRSHGSVTLRPVDPLIATTGLLTQVQRELGRQQDRLLQGYVAAAELHQRQLHDKRPGEVPSVLTQLLTDRDEIAERWTTSIHTTQCTYRSIAAHDPTQTAPILPSPLNSQCDSMKFRELCTPEFLADPRGKAAVRAAIEAGVDVRTAHVLPARMIIVDDHFAVIGLVPAGDSGALLVRSSVLIAALTQYYDQLWASATPVVLPGSIEVSRTRRAMKSLGATEREVLTLLVHGLKDEAIARHLSISVRTVRRHIATVMEFVDAPTRFAAGAAAQRLGLLS